ncbi:MAG: hypothetical protein KatS3mg118_2776 [Paracoccaceae bacterium]|nr:MAG: hypothetical protein KatS3mg118_2776 [Paracoccaceae bacterium]
MRARCRASRYRKMRIHMIADEDAMSPLGSSSKLNAEWAFLQHLHELGHAAAGAWLGPACR